MLVLQNPSLVYTKDMIPCDLVSVFYLRTSSVHEHGVSFCARIC